MSDNSKTAKTQETIVNEKKSGQAGGMLEGLVRALTDGDQSGESVSAMLNVRMDVQIVIGRASLPLSNLISLSQGAVVELDRRIGDPIDVVVNGQVVARGELVSGGDNGLGVKLTEIVKEVVAPAR